MVVPYGAPESPHPRKFAFDSYVAHIYDIMFSQSNLHHAGANMEWARWLTSFPLDVIAWDRFTIWYVEKAHAVHTFINIPSFSAWSICHQQWKRLRDQECHLHPRGGCRCALETHRLQAQWQEPHGQEKKARREHGLHACQLWCVCLLWFCILWFKHLSRIHLELPLLPRRKHRIRDPPHWNPFRVPEKGR